MLLFFFTLLLPVIIGTILFIFYRDKVTNKELLGLLGLSVASFTIMFFFMRTYNVSDTRYYSEKVTSIRYYEEWDEWVKRRCSRTHCTGSGKTRSCYTTYYDCSYRRYNPEKWVKRLDSSSEYDISRTEYNKILKLWGGNRSFLDMNRDYYTIDGDAYQTIWDKNPLTTETYSFSETYENKTLTAKTLFNHEPYEPEKAKKKGLNLEPNRLNNGEREYIINSPYLTDTVRRLYNNLNSNSKNYNVYVIYFKNKDRNIAFEQRKQWQGGNDNELVICIGIDSKNDVTWVEPFSWAKKPIVEAKIRGYHAINKGEFDLLKFYPELKTWMHNDWKKRDFHDFDYIDIELTKGQIIWIWVLLSLINIGFSVYIVRNEFTRE